MEENKLLKLDLGCGKNKINAEFTGVDCIDFPGVDVVANLAEKKKGKFILWPWADNSVDEVHCSHFVEHLEPDERIHFANELYRV
jgi:predicted SAM-dependent methyltransferase